MTVLDVADVAEAALEVAAKVLREDGVEDRVGGGVDVRHDHDEDEEVPGLGQRRRGKGVVEEVGLVRGVADGVHHHAGHQHLHHSFPGPYRLHRPVAAPLGPPTTATAATAAPPSVPQFASSSVQGSAGGVSGPHLEAGVELLHAGEQSPSNHGVQRHLHHERHEVEEGGLEQLEDEEVTQVRVREDDEAVELPGGRREVRQLIEDDGGQSAQNGHGPDDRDDVEDFASGAHHVGFDREHDGDEPATTGDK